MPADKPEQEHIARIALRYIRNNQLTSITVLFLLFCVGIFHYIGLLSFDDPKRIIDHDTEIALRGNHINDSSFIKSCQRQYVERLYKVILRDNGLIDGATLDNIKAERYRLCYGFFGEYLDVIGEEAIFLRYALSDDEVSARNLITQNWAPYSNTVKIATMVLIALSGVLIIRGMHNLPIKRELLAISVAAITYIALAFGWAQQYSAATKAYYQLVSLANTFDARIVGAVSNFNRCLGGDRITKIHNIPLFYGGELYDQEPILKKESDGDYIFPDITYQTHFVKWLTHDPVSEYNRELMKRFDNYDECAKQSRDYIAYESEVANYKSIMDAFANSYATGIKIPIL